MALTGKAHKSLCLDANLELKSWWKFLLPKIPVFFVPFGGWEGIGVRLPRNEAFSY